MIVTVICSALLIGAVIVDALTDSEAARIRRLQRGRLPFDGKLLNRRTRNA